MITNGLREEYAGREDVTFLSKPASAEQLVSAANRMLGGAQ
jgi:hypothetical protein